MDILQKIGIMVVTLGVLVAFHEYGHYWVAKKCGIKVLKFSVGFGPSLLSWTDKHNTEFSLSAIPLGGFVKMLDEREGEVDDSEKHLAFNNQPVWQRILVVAAGPVANFILAIFVYWLVFLQGITQVSPVVFSVDENAKAYQSGLRVQDKILAVDGHETVSAQQVLMRLLDRIGGTGTIELRVINTKTLDERAVRLPIYEWQSKAEDAIDPAADLGFGFYEPVIEPVIHSVLKDSAAEAAGLKPGDKIMSVDGEPVDSWQSWVEAVQASPERTLELGVLRQGNSLTLSLTPSAEQIKGKTVGLAGVKVKAPAIPENLIYKQDYGVLSAWVPAVKRTWQNIVFSLSSLKKLVLGQLSYKQLSGPITIAQVANDSFNVSFFAYLGLLALLSVSLGVLNLLPVPVLDGGHLFFYVIEWIKGSPVSEKVQMVAYQIGLFIVLSIMCLALFNDLNRLT